MSPEMQQPPPPRAGSIPRTLIGAFLVLIGLLLALDQLGWVEANHLMRFWPILVVLYGLTVLQRGGRGVIYGTIVVLIGGWLLLNTLHWLILEPWQFIWPLILVVVGARVLMRSAEPRWQSPPTPSTSAGLGSQPGSPPALDHISMFGMMGGTKRRVAGAIFRSADMTSLMGGCELDLRDALLGADGTAHIEVFSLMGGNHIFVPPNWTVILQVTPIMGGVEDKTRPVMGGNQHLYVRGTVLMGGVEVSN
jgi:cell wall-active antibiotic response 4TMS protein YvqF